MKSLKFSLPLLVLFILIVSLFAASLYQRYPNEDEAVIAGHSYFFNKLGYVKSDLYGGYGQNWEIRQYHYHKLFVLFGSLFSKIGGFNIYSFKLVSLFFTILFGFFLFAYIKEKKLSDKPLNFFLAASSILLLNSLFFDHAFMFRPEIMLMTLGFISYYYLDKGLTNKYLLYFILAGIFAGLSTFTHLNGIIYSVAGFFLILLRKQFKALLIFSIFAGSFSLLYFFDISGMIELKMLINQFTTDPNVVDKQPLLINLLNEQARFFWNLRMTVFSILFIFAFALSYNLVKINLKNTVIYLLFLVIALGLFAHGKTIKYGLNYFPYMTLIITYGLYKIFEKENKPVKYAFSVLILIYASIHIHQDIQIFSDRIGIQEHNEKLSAIIPEKNVKISAPSVFAFNEIENYTIRGQIAFDHHYSVYKKTREKNFNEYLKFASNNGDKYVLIDQGVKNYYYISSLDLSSFNTGDIHENYKLINKGESFLLFSKIK